ncbi:hypothetical protein DVH24_003147 [Malus domestica]|uniref:Uncharacterized protein n=1 Tax=Malus domestica TaxID=3750 RepID=A0A498K497_MALDO|nr:hypothetical protein DVH24_003147 [Malus domestica]
MGFWFLKFFSTSEIQRKRLCLFHSTLEQLSFECCHMHMIFTGATAILITNDFYSAAWDVIVPFGGLLFAGIIYLQHKFGARCILPQKVRELCEYAKVAAVNEG